jgi:hypothetical protein
MYKQKYTGMKYGHVTTWMSLDNRVSERSQSKKGQILFDSIYITVNYLHRFAYECNKYTNYKQEIITLIGKHIQKESK